MFQSIEGVYKNGNIQLSELPSDVSESKVIVTFLEPQKAKISKRIMQFGMFAGNQQSTEKDLQITKFYGDGKDGLDYK